MRIVVRNFAIMLKYRLFSDDCFDGVDLFGKKQQYQCNCKYLRDCKFQNFHECEYGCLPGFEEPYCQKRR